MIIEIDKYTNSIKDTLLAFYAERNRANAMYHLAERDSLTGIKNKTAYDFALQDIEQSIADGNACFAIAVIDLNCLKKINDTYGHERGNCIIIALCKMICAIFDHFPVYRIGGDEFAVICNNATPDSINPLVTQFIDTMRKAASDTTLEPWERVSAAIGVAFYDPEKDTDADSVFKRADMAMYTMKKQMNSANLL